MKKTKDFTSENYVRIIGNESYKRILDKMSKTTGLSYTYLDLLLRQFATEFADEMAVSEIVSVPLMGNFKIVRPDGSTPRVRFLAGKTFMEIFKNGGTDANKSLRELGIIAKGAITERKGDS
jgi:hypothetical protein